MRLVFKSLFLTLVIGQVQAYTFGQSTGESAGPRTTDQIDSICTSIDNNRSLVEGIAEGEYIPKKGKKGGWETYDLKDLTGQTLYRIKYNLAAEQYHKMVFYYLERKLVKAIVSIEDSKIDKTNRQIYLATYYFDDNKLLKSKGENIKHSKAAYVLSEGLTFQSDFYTKKK